MHMTGKSVVALYVHDNINPSADRGPVLRRNVTVKMLCFWRNQGALVTRPGRVDALCRG